MIKVIAGAAIYNDGVKCRAITREDGAVSLPEWAERRFVSQGVARYVEKRAPEAPKKVEETPVEVVDETYESMTAAELKAECDERGIPYNARASKAQLIKALEADDAPPELNALGAE